MTSRQIDLQQVLSNLGVDALNARPPVEKWSPQAVSEVDIEIRVDGSWWHEGTRIQRHELVKLFASILIFDDGDYFLVTPAEKCRVRVQDVPFVVDVIAARPAGNNAVGQPQYALKCVTNVGEEVVLGAQHPLQLKQDAKGTQVPYVLIRNGMLARFGRNAYYELVSLASIEQRGEHDIAVLHLSDTSFELGEI